MTISVSSHGFYRGRRSRLPAEFALALARLADDAGVSPERFARELLEIGLIDAFERRYAMPLGAWIARLSEPARLGQAAGRNGEAAGTLFPAADPAIGPA